MTENVKLKAGENAAPVVARPDFHKFAAILAERYRKLSAKTRVFKAEIDKGVLFQAYLDGFVDAATRQYYNCECCRQFLNSFGQMLVIDPKTGLTRSAIWHLEEDESIDLSKTEYTVFLPSMYNMLQALEGAKIRTVFVSKYETLGIPEKGNFNHFFITNGNRYNSLIPTAPQAMLGSREDRRILAEFMGPADLTLLKNALTFFKNDAKLRNDDGGIRILEWAVGFKEKLIDLKDRRLNDTHYWNAVATKSKGYLRIGQGVVGNFLATVAKGEGYDKAKGEYLAQTDMSKRMVATEKPKAGNLRQAESLFASNPALAAALRRRRVTFADVATKVWEPTVDVAEEAPKSIFGHLKARDEPVKPKASPMPPIDGGIITGRRFAQEILPTAAKIFVNLRYQAYDFMGLITAVDPEAEPLILWDTPEHRNPVSGYSYVGGSQPSSWSLPTGQLIEVLYVLPAAGHFNHPIEKIKGCNVDLFFVLKGAKDVVLNQIPLSPELVRRDLHEIRQTLSNYFTQGKLEPLGEGQVEMSGLNWPISADGASIGVNLRVVTHDGATIDYGVDRSF